MADAFDPRIVGPDELAFLQACQRRVPFHLQAFRDDLRDRLRRLSVPGEPR